jgi:hypothetical protein
MDKFGKVGGAILLVRYNYFIYLHLVCCEDKAMQLRLTLIFTILVDNSMDLKRVKATRIRWLISKTSFVKKNLFSLSREAARDATRRFAKP